MGKHKKKNKSKISATDRSHIMNLTEELMTICTSLPSGNAKKEFEEYETMQNLLSEIQIIESEYELEFPRGRENWENFNKWCINNGAIIKGAQVRSIEDGEFGIFATKKLEEGKEVISVPRSMMLTTKNARSSKMASFIETDPVLKAMPNVVLALYLLLELYSGEASFWWPYISILPRRYNTVLYYSVEDMKLLQGSAVIDEAVKICRSISRQYAYFFKQFHTDPLTRNLPFRNFFTYNLYRWAVSTVMTRQNPVPSEDGSSVVTALVPLYDMCNHRNGKLSTDYDLEKDELRCYAMKDFEKNEEVCIFYGQRTNGEFLLHNGFVYLDNINNSVDLKIGISKNDPLFSEKVKLCEKYELPISGIFSISRDYVPKKVGIFLKILVYKQGEAAAGGPLDEMEINGDIFDEKDKDNKAVLEFLQTRITLLLRASPKTAEEFKAIISAPDSQPASVLVSKFRLSEQRVLANMLHNLAKALSSF